MKKALFSPCFLLWTVCLFSQTVSQKLETAYQQFEADSQLTHAISSLYVIDAKTGEVIFDKNSRIGLAPASTQKIITSATTFELLGKDYRYKTEFGYIGTIEKRTLKGDLYLIGSGDPTLGSWRWERTKEKVILQQLANATRKAGIGFIIGSVVLGDAGWQAETTPNGWIWQDIGNYYGAGASFLNWRENQFDVFLRSGNKIGDSVHVVSYDPPLVGYRLQSNVTTAAKGTGDNAYIYKYNDDWGVIRGTIPPGESRFKIAGTLPSPHSQMIRTFLDSLFRAGVQFSAGQPSLIYNLKEPPKPGDENLSRLYIHYSPSLDSIIYWFNKRSVNLYGEALIKTIGFEKKGFGVTDTGVVVVRDFWKEKGLNEDELNIYDGSGLSPLNRVTTHAQVEILKYAQTRDWYPDFYDALPEYNAIKMKSGTISDVKGFCGYHKAKDGKEYIFSFLVNNYNGRSSELVGKMYRVLDVLK